MIQKLEVLKILETFVDFSKNLQKRYRHFGADNDLKELIKKGEMVLYGVVSFKRDKEQRHPFSFRDSSIARLISEGKKQNEVAKLFKLHPSRIAEITHKEKGHQRTIINSIVTAQDTSGYFRLNQVEARYLITCCEEINKKLTH